MIVPDCRVCVCAAHDSKKVESAIHHVHNMVSQPGSVVASAQTHSTLRIGALVHPFATKCMQDTQLIGD